MKRLSMVLLATGLMVCASHVANANLLDNGGMNDGTVTTQILRTPTGYVAASNHLNANFESDGLSSETFANLALDTGTGTCRDTPASCGVFFKIFRGNVPGVPNPSTGLDFQLDASLHQDKPATPGLKYTLLGWIAAGPGYSGENDANSTTTEFGLEFLDAGGGVIGGDILSLGNAELSQDTPFNRDYARYMAMAVAPAGTVTVRSRMTLTDAWLVPGAGDSAVVTDKWALSIPEPTSLALVGMSLVGFLGMRRR